MMWTNTMGKGAYRGPWMFETTAREMAIDYAAREIGLDPAEFRRKNLLAAGDLPYTAPAGQVFTEITPLETLEQALEILDYDAFRKEQAAARAEGRYLGLGLSVYVEPTSMGGADAAHRGRHGARRVERQGRGVPRHHVARPERGDHDGAGRRRHARRRATTTSPSCRPTRSRLRTAPAPAGAAPRSIAGGAAREATVAVRDKVLQVAAHVMEASPDDLEIAEQRRVGAGHADEVDVAAATSPSSRTSTPTRCRPTS